MKCSYCNDILGNGLCKLHTKVFSFVTDNYINKPKETRMEQNEKNLKIGSIGLNRNHYLLHIQGNNDVDNDDLPCKLNGGQVMSNLLIKEVFVNVTENYNCGESEVYETFTNDIGQLFRSLKKEHGRCVSKAYIDVDGESKQTGWVFQKKQKYKDTNEIYLKETWVELHERKPETTIKEFFKIIG